MQLSAPPTAKVEPVQAVCEVPSHEEPRNHKLEVEEEMAKRKLTGWANRADARIIVESRVASSDYGSREQEQKREESLVRLSSEKILHGTHFNNY